MPYFIDPFCKSEDYAFNGIIQTVYYFYMEFLLYADKSNYYFSNIMNDDFIKQYLDLLNGKIVEDYYYDICDYLNSEEIDLFLLEKLKTNKKKDYKENIIRILSNKFDERVIPFALEFIEKEKSYDEEEICLSLAPLLIVKNYNTELTDLIIKKAKEYF